MPGKMVGTPYGKFKHVGNDHRMQKEVDIVYDRELNTFE